MVTTPCANCGAAFYTSVNISGRGVFIRVIGCTKCNYMNNVETLFVPESDMYMRPLCTDEQPLDYHVYAPIVVPLLLTTKGFAL